jgi:hypothetical protein
LATRSNEINQWKKAQHFIARKIQVKYDAGVRMCCQVSGTELGPIADSGSPADRIEAAAVTGDEQAWKPSASQVTFALSWKLQVAAKSRSPRWPRFSRAADRLIYLPSLQRSNEIVFIILSENI